MGRTGGGGGGGRAGGGHVGGGGRTGGGHVGGGGARPGAGMGGGGMGGPRGGMGGAGGMGPRGPRGPMGPGRRPRRHFRFGGRFGRRFGRYGYGGGCLSTLLMPFIIILIVIVLIVSVISSTIQRGVRGNNGVNSASSVTETVQEPEDTYTGTASASSSSGREKIDSGLSFHEDCILDELGWVEDPSYVAAGLETFYDQTGIQPYIYLKAYDSSLSSYSDKENYAFDWYDENIDNESTFLFIYFAEEDSENDVGYMVYVNGYDIDSVMDEDAVDIFWDYVDEYWYSDLSTDDMLIQIYTNTAAAIMK